MKFKGLTVNWQYSFSLICTQQVILSLDSVQVFPCVYSMCILHMWKKDNMCVCTSWEETDAGTDSFYHWVTHSVISGGVLAIFLYYLCMYRSAPACSHVLYWGQTMDWIIRWGNKSHIALLYGILLHVCVVLSCLVTIQVVHFHSLRPEIWCPEAALVQVRG